MKKLLSSFSNSVRFWCSGVVSFVWESPCLDAFAMSLKMSNRKSTNGHSHYLLLFQWIIIKKTKQKHNDLPFNKTLWDDTAKSIPPSKKKTKKKKQIYHHASRPRGQRDCKYVNLPCSLSAAGRTLLQLLSRALCLFQRIEGEKEWVIATRLRRVETRRLKLAARWREQMGGRGEQRETLCRRITGEHDRKRFSSFLKVILNSSSVLCVFSVLCNYWWF